MYEAYFNLRVKPFELVPDPKFIFLSKAHKKALSFLNYGIHEHSGFIVLTGEIGSGKTTLIRELYNKHSDQVVLAKVFNTCVTFEQLLAMINDDFGLSVHGKDKVTLIRDLNGFLVDQYACGNQPILIIDEAQNLGVELLEEIRMLSNLETDDSKLLQIILVGQPELRTILASPKLLQLRQRISINCHIHALNLEETMKYISHRLGVAGNANAIDFSAETMDYIFQYSRGIPRLINIICDFLMLSAFAEESKTISVEMVREVVGDLDFDTHYWSRADSINSINSSTGTAGLSSTDRHVLTPLGGFAPLQEMSQRIESLEKSVFQLQTLLEASLDKVMAVNRSGNKHADKADAQIVALNARHGSDAAPEASRGGATNDPAFKRFTQWIRSSTSGE
jgi:putative secretion ATPase (PEP-CTERM system associated)